MAHDHHYSPKDNNFIFAFSVILNLIFVVVEVIYGMISDSIALIADAGHNFSDVISLLLAWGASVLATSKPTRQRTYGYRRVTIIASLVSAILLLFALGGIAWEAVGRFSRPEPIDGMTIVVVAGIGVLINSATALLFIRGQHHDLNLKAAYLHMAADAGVSLGVVIAGILIILTGWVWLDPAISIVIVIVVMFASLRLFRDSMNLSIDAVPDNIDLIQVETYLLSLNNVTSLHDLHVWALSTTETALTVHIVLDELENNDLFLQDVSRDLASRFGIGHTTIQLETSNPDNICNLDRPECI